MAQGFLHDLPRIDHSFNSVSNEIIIPDTPRDIFAWNTNSYQQSIQMFAYIPIAIGLIYAQTCIIIMLIYCCFGRCNCNNMFSYGKASNPQEDENYHKLSLLHDNQEDENVQLTKCSRFIRWAFSLLILVTLGFTIVYGTSFNESIIKMANNWTDSYDDYETIVSDAIQINEQYIPNSQLQCKLILNTATAAPIYPNITALNNTLGIAQTFVSLFLTSSSNVPSWDVVNDSITPYREFGIIFPVIALVLFGLLNVLNYLCFSHDYLNKKLCFCSCSFLIIYFGLFIFIIGCMQFAVSVLIADGCNDPDGSIWQAIEQYNHDDITNDILKYYLFCNENDTVTNPLYAEFNSSYYELTSMNQSIYTLYYTNISQILGIVDEADALYNDYTQSLLLMNEINDTMQCDNIDNYKVNMIDELCGKALDFWLVYYTLQITFILLLVIRSWLICTKNKSQDNQMMSVAEPNMNQDYGTHRSMDEGESQLEFHVRADSRADSIFIVKANINDAGIVESDSEQKSDEEKTHEIQDVLINIKCDDKVTEYQINGNKTVYDLMEMIENVMDIDTAEQKLMLNGNPLVPNEIVRDTIKTGDTVDLVVLEVTLSNGYDKHDPEQGDDLVLPQ